MVAVFLVERVVAVWGAVGFDVRMVNKERVSAKVSVKIRDFLRLFHCDFFNQGAPLRSPATF